MRTLPKQKLDRELRRQAVSRVETESADHRSAAGTAGAAAEPEVRDVAHFADGEYEGRQGRRHAEKKGGAAAPQRMRQGFLRE